MQVNRSYHAAPYGPTLVRRSLKDLIQDNGAHISCPKWWSLGLYKVPSHPLHPLPCTKVQWQASLVAPHNNTKTNGAQAFSIFAPNEFNAIPLSVQMAPSLSVSKSRLKTHLYCIAYGVWVSGLLSCTCLLRLATTLLLSLDSSHGTTTGIFQEGCGRTGLTGSPHRDLPLVSLWVSPRVPTLFRVFL